MNLPTITPQELQSKLLDPHEKTWTVLDVREPEEWEICLIEGSLLRPLSEINTWEDEILNLKGPLAVICHHGVRSARACSYLTSKGGENLFNVGGGIDRWKRDVAPEMRSY
ncbi:MAG: sulfurtransferase [Planctomycetes bacterium]|nr:sulfurtransferase [Planctomycetota bacterium]